MDYHTQQIALFMMHTTTHGAVCDLIDFLNGKPYDMHSSSLE